jgi:hypothetical protein
VLATAPHTAAVGDDLATATKRYRDAIGTLAVRLHEVGGLRPDMTVQDATDTLWFFLGYAGYFTLVDDLGWSYDRAEQWLIRQATAALRG